jgi:hypothetical protein
MKGSGWRWPSERSKGDGDPSPLQARCGKDVERQFEEGVYESGR